MWHYIMNNVLNNSFQANEGIHKAGSSKDFKKKWKV